MNLSCDAVFVSADVIRTVVIRTVVIRAVVISSEEKNFPLHQKSQQELNWLCCRKMMHQLDVAIGRRYFRSMTTAPFNVDTIVATTFVRSVRFLETTPSTNEVAKDMARGSSPEWPLLVITNRQTAGRGRHGNRWWSASGSLTFSVVIGGVCESEGLIAFAAALAISKAIEKTCPSAGPKLKWPNDVFLANKKVAGVLIESVITPDQRLFVVGIGVNSNCDISNAPKAVRDLATSLSSEFDRKLDQESFLIEVLNRLDKYLDSAIHTPVEIVDSFQHASEIEVSARLTVRSANGQQRSGEFAGFGTHGQLLIKIGSEIEELATGTIVEYT